MKYSAFARRYKRGPLNNRRKLTPPIEPEPPPKNKEPPDKKKYRPTRHNKEYLQKRVNAIAKMLIMRSPAPLIAGGRRRIINEHHIYAREHHRSTFYHRRGPRASFRRRQYHHTTPNKTEPTVKPSKNQEVIHAPPPTHKKVSTQQLKFQIQPPPNNSPFCTFIDEDGDDYSININPIRSGMLPMLGEPADTARGNLY